MSTRCALAGFPISVTVNDRPCTEYPNVVVRFTNTGSEADDGAWDAAAIADVPAVGAMRAGSGGGADEMAPADDMEGAADDTSARATA
jgi:hypothetical protein